MSFNGDGGGVHSKNTVELILTMETDTFQVTIGGDVMAISLAQMIVDEGARLLESQRRLAQAQMLKQHMAQEAADEAIRQALAGGRAR